MTMEIQDSRRRTPAAEQLLTRFAGLQETEPTKLHVAENILLFDQLRRALTAECRLVLEDIGYQPAHGHPDFNTALAAFLNRSFELRGTAAIRGEHVSCASGVRSALEMASHALLGRGQNVLMPAPYWQGFEWIYGDRLGGKVVAAPLDSACGFELTLDDLKAAYDRSVPSPKALVLTHPHNPLGINYSRKLLEDILRWAVEDKEMQVISDEIYAHCQLPSLDGPPFVSALALPIALARPEKVHAVWGFSKDFGLSGFRAGALVSRSKALHDAVRRPSETAFSPLTSSNTWFLNKLFVSPPKDESTDPAEPTWADQMMKALVPRLERSHRSVTDALDRVKLPRFQGSHAAQFVWLDLRRWLPQASSADLAAEAFQDLEGLELLGELGLDPREEALYLKLIKEARVSLLPGGTLNTPEAGFFRLCYTAQTDLTVVDAVRRIAEVLPGSLPRDEGPRKPG